MNMQFPLISCICVTRAKPIMLQRAIDCFEAQTYPNRELVILYEDDDEPTARFLGNTILSPRVKVIVAPRLPDNKLGQLRNSAIRSASGQLICQWDDDDWCHSGRLERQYEAMVAGGLPGSVMMHWLVFDATTGKTYISTRRPWEGSLLCEKELLLERQYENKAAGEDTPVISYLHANGRLQPMADTPWLYIYIYHGGNTWNHNHWRELFDNGVALPSSVNATIAGIVDHSFDVTTASALLNELADSYKQIKLEVYAD